MPKVLNVRGTHGSGKSTVVRRIKDLYQTISPTILPGRGRPFGYNCQGANYEPVYIPGHYETPTGGCDTISSIEDIFGSVLTAAEAGISVLFEGIVAQHSATRLFELNSKHPVTVIVLKTTLELCIESVIGRRKERGQDGPFNPRNVEKEFKSVLSSTKRLKENGIKVLELDREEAFAHCEEVLRCAG